MAQDEKTIVRSVLDPTLVLDELSLEDVFTGTSDKLPENYKNLNKGKGQMQNFLGTEIPMVVINNYVIRMQDLYTFIIDTTDFIPKLFLQFDMFATVAFTSQSMPQDGDLVSVFIKAKNDVFKPIRNDYVITSVDVSKGGMEGIGARVTILGELFIPTIYDEVVKAYKGTSLDVLKNIAKDLNLGFATNETSTNDSQTWICASDNLKSLIQHVASHSWKTSTDFYKVYIDVYYHLNFINLNNQFSGNSELAAGILDSSLFKNYFGDQADVKAQTQASKVLSNLENLQNTNYFISQWKIINDSSRISKEFGYKMHAQFFDQKSLKYFDLYIDPVKNTDLGLLKGRTFPKKDDQTEGDVPSEESWWKTQNRKVWLGVQTKNVHDNYFLAEIMNKRNLLESSKFYIEVDIPRWNPNIYGSERIPIILMNITDSMKKNVDAIGESAGYGNEAIPSIDQLYTGFYVVDGMRFTYVRDGSKGSFTDTPTPIPMPDFKQTIVLKRREWPAP